MIRHGLLITLASAPLLSGCAAVSLATLPVRAGTKVVNTTSAVYDRATVSNSERDERRGREIRKREERLASAQRDHAREQARCADGKASSCDKAAQLQAEIDALAPTLPAATSSR